jgi:hypothetical protein
MWNGMIFLVSTTGKKSALLDFKSKIGNIKRRRQNTKRIHRIHSSCRNWIQKSIRLEKAPLLSFWPGSSIDICLIEDVPITLINEYSQKYIYSDYSDYSVYVAIDTFFLEHQCTQHTCCMNM